MNPPPKKKIAIIGAGIAGLVLARELAEDFDVTVFEKSRGAGGRMSTRRSGPHRLDHGAQYFTARGRRFKAFLRPYLEQGVVALWEGNITTLHKGPKHYKRIWFEPHYVGQPDMNSLCRELGRDISIQLETEIQPLEGNTGPWPLMTSAGNPLGNFDWVIGTAPAAQLRTLLPAAFSGQPLLAGARMSGCMTLMILLSQEPRFSWDAAVVKDSLLDWVALNHHKPGRDRTRPALIAHSTNAWAEQMQTAPDHTVQEMMLAELLAQTDLPATDLQDITLHRWHYAAVEEISGQPFLIDEERGLAACGDWCVGSRVESAFISAVRLAQRLKKLP